MVGFSQVLFHLLFSMGAGHSSMLATAPGGHEHHGMAMTLDMSSTPSASIMSHGDSTMLLAHFFAGLATVLVLYRGEQLLIVVSDFIALFTWKLLRQLVKFAYQPVLPQPVPTAPREIPSYTVAVYATSVIRRGPPALTTV
ncbi:hypothetical protein ACT3UD_02895 [Glutamicibacter sp. 287]|uniref:hypothetical protein n=1 Tax=unclassified Glutamicibacter TaxID=2627139 RepID=UPI0040332702